jgi:hypothetical protein
MRANATPRAAARLSPSTYWSLKAVKAHAQPALTISAWRSSVTAKRTATGRLFLWWPHLTNPHDQDGGRAGHESRHSISYPKTSIRLIRGKPVDGCCQKNDGKNDASECCKSKRSD